MGTNVVLVCEAQGLRVCLECHAALERGEDEATWLGLHLGGAEGVGCTLPASARRQPPA